MKKTRLIAALLAPLALFAAGIEAAPVNVNKASAEEIAAALPGIGPAKAQAIVEYRTANGPFKTAADVGKVKGIGDKTLEKLAADIKLE